MGMFHHEADEQTRADFVIVAAVFNRYVTNSFETHLIDNAPLSILRNLL